MRNLVKFGFKTVDFAMHSVAHSRHVEVQEQAKLAAAQFQIRQQLRQMNWKNAFDTFQLNDQAILDDEVNAIRDWNFDAVVHQRQVNFVFKTANWLLRTRNRGKTCMRFRAGLGQVPCEP